MEIIFKAYNKKTGVMLGHKHQHVCVSDGVICIVNYVPSPRGTWVPEAPYQLTWEETKDLVIVQYTGIKDSNGVEIYTGDIIRINGESDDNCSTVEDITSLEWLHGFIDRGREVEVVGNIYQKKKEK